MTDKITPQQAQLARLSWVLKQGALEAGVTFSVPGIQRLAMSMHKVMLDNDLHLIWHASLEDALKALEQEASK